MLEVWESTTLKGPWILDEQTKATADQIENDRLFIESLQDPRTVRTPEPEKFLVDLRGDLMTKNSLVEEWPALGSPEQGLTIPKR